MSMWKCFVDGFKQGYYGQLGKPVPKTANKTSLSQFLGQWQAVTDRSQARADALLADANYRTHFKILNWAITGVMLVAILVSVF